MWPRRTRRTSESGIRASPFLQGLDGPVEPVLPRLDEGQVDVALRGIRDVPDDLAVGPLGLRVFLLGFEELGLLDVPSSPILSLGSAGAAVSSGRGEVDVAQRPEPLPDPGAVRRRSAGAGRRAQTEELLLELPGHSGGLGGRRRGQVLSLAGIADEVVELGPGRLDVLPGARDQADELGPAEILPRVEGLDEGVEVPVLLAPHPGGEVPALHGAGFAGQAERRQDGRGHVDQPDGALDDPGAGETRRGYGR